MCGLGFGESNKAQGRTAGLIPAESYYTTRPGEAGKKQLLEPRERQNMHYGDRAIDKYWDLQVLGHAASSKLLCWKTVNKIDIFILFFFFPLVCWYSHWLSLPGRLRWGSPLVQVHRLPSTVKSVNSGSWKGKRKPGPAHYVWHLATCGCVL